MIELRRVRTDNIALVGPGGERTTLANRQRDVFWAGLAFASQRAIQVSPDGAALAFVDLDSGTLHVRDARKERFKMPLAVGGDVRFSPDSRWIAAQVPRRNDRPLGRRQAGVMIIDATDGGVIRHAALPHTRWVEWVADGVVVLHKDGKDDALTLLGHDGTFRRLVTSRTRIRRFAAAPRSNRIAWFADAISKRGRRKGELVLRAMDAAEPGASVTRIANVRGFRNNAEISPDGATIAWAATEGVFVHEQGTVRLLDKARGVHSVWFGRDGQLAWAHPRGIGWWHNDAIQRHTTKRRIRTMRLRRGGPGVLFADGYKLHSWTPASGTTAVLGAASSGNRLVSGDVFAGGVVLWQTHTTHHRRRPWRKLRKLPRLKNAPQRLLL